MALRLESALIQPTGNRLDVIAAYAIGTVAAFWLIERTSAFCVTSAKVAQAAPEVRLTTSGFGAQSGHADRRIECQLLGEERTCRTACFIEYTP
jgi:hypothetical protein